MKNDFLLPELNHVLPAVELGLETAKATKVNNIFSKTCHEHAGL